MNNKIRFVLISLVIATMSTNISHAGGFKLIAAEDGTRNSHMTADIIGDTLAVGVHEGLGYVKIYVGADKKWKEQAELVALVGGADINKGVPGFGWSVALTALHEHGSADFAAIGAARDNPKGDLSGSAYIFARSRNTWKERAKLVASDGAKQDNFGWAVAIDRNIAVVGSPGNDHAGSSSGAAYVFTFDGANWKEKVKLIPAALDRSAALGTSVLVQKDTVIVGAPKQTHGGVRFTGAAFVFQREGDQWVESATLSAADADKSDGFGTSVAMSGDTVVVGAPLADTDRGKDAGAAYVFVRDGGGWKQEAKLSSSDAKKADQFGFSVAVAGHSVIVGAKTRDESEPGSGAAYSFARSDGVWEQKRKVVPDDPGQKINYGAWVALSGNTVIVSAHNGPNDGPEWGKGHAVHIYNGTEDLEIVPFSVDPTGLAVTTFGKIRRTALLQNFPNPFNPETWLPYRLAADAPVNFRIYNVRGQQIRELDLGVQKAGDYLSREAAAYWDGRDEVGQNVSSGVYFYSLQADTFRATRRMLILK